MTHKNTGGLIAGVEQISGMPMVEGAIDTLHVPCFSRIIEATYDEVDRVDQLLTRKLLASWGFTQGAWRNDLCNVVVELLSNIVEHGRPKDPRTPHCVHVLFYSLCSERHRYFFCLMDTNRPDSIDPTKLRRENIDPSAERGRGTHIVVSLTDAFAVLRGLNGYYFMKRASLDA